MEHTFLFKTQEWATSGKYFDENDNYHELTGISKVVREEGSWTLSGFIEVVLNNEPIKLLNDYQIEEESGSGIINWKSDNPDLGLLIGVFVVVDDTIISSYSSEDGKYSGFETLTKIDDATYKNIGISFEGSTRMSSWSVIFKSTGA